MPDHIILLTVLEIGDLSPIILAHACKENNLKPIAARNTAANGLWYGLRYFSYGKGCVGRVHTALRDKTVQLLMGMPDDLIDGQEGGIPPIPPPNARLVGDVWRCNACHGAVGTDGACTCGGVPDGN